jgi:cation diffusion facilitator CzcD-associated flavoprotein CzcO
MANKRAIVLGAGMAGILAAIKLKETDGVDVVVYEKSDRVGGTWRENTYPV